MSEKHRERSQNETVNGCENVKMKHRMQTKGGVQVSQGGLERREGLGMGEREELEEEEGAVTKKQSQKIV
jgi:hypothetical protein